MSLIELPKGCHAIGSKWIFRIKEKSDGSVERYKARLVAQGFLQREGYDFHETFSPVVKPTTVRLILSLSLANNWSIHQIDINNAFLNGYLTEAVFMKQPQGFEAENKNLVCKLHKSLYGLKQAP